MAQHEGACEVRSLARSTAGQWPERRLPDPIGTGGLPGSSDPNLLPPLFGRLIGRAHRQRQLIKQHQAGPRPPAAAGPTINKAPSIPSSSRASVFSVQCSLVACLPRLSAETFCDHQRLPVKPSQRTSPAPPNARTSAHASLQQPTAEAEADQRQRVQR